MKSIFTTHVLNLFAWFVISICLPPTLFADGEEGSCAGSLGDNIFTNGDFGSGAPNLIATNPQIAPGYSYTTNVPPGDGFYTVTNNMGLWSNLYSSWLPIGDNSNDPNGYMMVVNADFSPGLFYEQTVTNLCANTQYEFSADIINVIRVGIGDHSDPNVDFALNGNVLLSTGNIVKSNKWTNYSFSFCTGENENSLVLSLINNAPGGIGNDLALDNISFRACGPPARITTDESITFICFEDDIEDYLLEATVEDDTYTFFQWQVRSQGSPDWQDIAGATNATYLMNSFPSGTSEYRYLLANSFDNLQNNKCRLYSSIKEIVVLPIAYDVNKTICEGNGWEVGSNIHTDSGVYLDSLVSSIGCDSIITTNLTVLPDPNMDVVVEVTIPTCVGYSNGLIEVSEVLGGSPPYTYWLDGSLNNIGTTFRNLSTGTYELQVLDQYGCDYTTQILIEEPEALIVETNENTTISIGESLTLSSLVTHTDVSYNWAPAIGLDCTTCPSPTAMPFESQTYVVWVKNGDDCSAVDSVRIEVDKNFRLAISTAFSPNEDGINDYFEIATPFTGAIQEFKQMKVFNRWGQVIYEQSAPAKSPFLAKWDGRNDFRLVDAGVYVYYLEFELIDGSPYVYSGTVTVVY